MNNRTVVWLKTILLLAIAIAINVILFGLQDYIPHHAFSRFAPLVVIFSLMLAVEAANQSATDKSSRPSYQLFGKYRSSRDKVVVIVAYLIAVILFWLPINLGDDFVSEIVLRIVLAGIAYFGTCFILGTNELRAGVTPQFVKRLLYRKQMH